MQKIKMFALGALMCGLTLGALPNATAEDEVNYQPLTFSADVGTLGLGVSASWRFSDHFGIRGGVNYLKYEDDGNEIEGITYNTDLRLLSEPIGVDFYFSKNSSLRLTLGVLINQNEMKGVMPQLAPGQTVTFGNSGLTWDQTIGDLNLRAEQQAVSPYLAIGGSVFLDRAKHWAIHGELGVAYTGSPDVTLTHTSGVVNATLSQDEADEARQIEDKLEDYKFYPIIKLGISFSF